MENKQLFKIEVNINDLINVDFKAEEIPCERGKIYREKKFEKKLCDLAHITLFGPEKRIMLRVGVFCIPFTVTCGNTDIFYGHYEISYLGHNGTADVTVDDEE